MSLESIRAEPLPRGTRIGQAFLILEDLGRTTWLQRYLAIDLREDAEVMLSEYLPPGATRLDDGLWDLSSVVSALHHRALWDIRRCNNKLAGVRTPFVAVPLRTEFENRTVYWSNPWVGAPTLAGHLKNNYRLSATEALQFFRSGLDLLDELRVHRLRLGGFSPQSVRIREDGSLVITELFLPFEWQLDARNHPEAHADGFGAPEQHSEMGLRDWNSDLYSLAAVTWFGLSGQRVPENPSMAGIGQLIQRDFFDALVTCLIKDCYLRPKDSTLIRALLNGERAEPAPSLTWTELDAKLTGSRKLKTRKRECPGCGGVISIAKQAKEHAAFGPGDVVQARDLSNPACPVCKVGVLNAIENRDPLRICPSCGKGWLWSSAIKAPWSAKVFTCETCQAKFATRGNTVVTENSGQATTWDALRELSERSADIWSCDNCSAQLDNMPDGRRKLVVPEKSPEGQKILTAEEWSRVGQGVDPGSGNAHAKLSGEDYHLDARGMSLLENSAHPWAGVFVDHHRARWIAAGKMSGEAGLICKTCELEFDPTPAGEWKLIQPGKSDRAEVLRAHAGEVLPLWDWVRMAQDLPTEVNIPILEQLLDERLLEAWERSELGNQSDWESPVTDHQTKHGRLSVNAKGIRYDRLLKKHKWPWDQIEAVTVPAHDQLIVILKTGERWGFEIVARNLGIELKSGWHEVPLTAHNLAARCNHLLNLTNQRRESDA